MEKKPKEQKVFYTESILTRNIRELKPRIYISGPISGYDLDERRKAFKEVQEMLESKGLDVFNPMENGLPAEATTHEHMHRDLAELTREDYGHFDAIYMMQKWTHSAGCKLEFDVATSIGLNIYFEEVDKWGKFE